MFTRRIWSATKVSLRRQVSTTKASFTAEKSPLFTLRQRTGLAYNLCREALNKHDNNVNEAETWLKAQALAHGLQRATKVSGRSTREGLIGISVCDQNKTATIVELNCETDFVAKNQMFKDLTLDITHQISSTLNKEHDTQNLINDMIRQVNFSASHAKQVESLIAPIITRLGESIKLQRALQFQVSHADVILSGKVHAQAGQKNVDGLDISAGRFGALVALQNLCDDSHEFDGRRLTAAASRLCQHVIGYSPSYIELPDDIRKKLEEVERLSKQEKPEEELRDEEYSDTSDDEAVAHNARDDWPSIMDQTLILSEDTVVRDFCRDNKFNLVYFERFECGTEI